MIPKDNIVSNPGSWPVLVRAAGAINRLAAQRTKITVWGHDDLDGIASTAIMMEALKGKAEVSYYIPPKNGVHYGLDVNVIDRLVTEGTGLIITVDGGISNYAEAEYCREKGLPLIITDHHELPAVLPPALAVVNPKIQEAGSPYANLCGAAVALYLAAAVEGVDSNDWLVINNQRLAWAALATVSDRVPLLEDNRMILQAGWKAITGEPILAKLAGILDFDLSHGLSPLILQNSYIPLFASSQSQGDSHPMVELLLGKIGEQEVKDLWNRQSDWRRRFAQELQKRISTAGGRGIKIIVAVDPDLPSDLIGPLAGGLRDSLLLPAIVIGKKGGAYVGEARGYLPFDFVEMLSGFKNYFIQHGGHKQAAGFTLKTGSLDELISGIARYSADHQDVILKSRPEHKYDYRFDDLGQLIEKIPELLTNGPYGSGNPWPNCLIGNVRLPKDIRQDQALWLDELLKLQGTSARNGTLVLAALDATSTGQISLSIKKHKT